MTITFLVRHCTVPWLSITITIRMTIVVSAVVIAIFAVIIIATVSIGIVIVWFLTPLYDSPSTLNPKP